MLKIQILTQSFIFLSKSGTSASLFMLKTTKLSNFMSDLTSFGLLT